MRPGSKGWWRGGPATPLLGFLTLGACVEGVPGPAWPEAPGGGTRILALVDPDGPVRLVRVRAEVLAVSSDTARRLFLLDYRCGNPGGLGFDFVGEDSLSFTAAPVRAPDAMFEFIQEPEPRFEPVPVTPGGPELELLGAELRFPSRCRAFRPVELPVVFEFGLRSRFLLTLPDRSVLLGVGVTGTSTVGARLYRVTSLTDYQQIELSAGFPADAAAVQPDGTLWLYGRSDGGLARGHVDRLLEGEAGFERLPNGAPARDCSAAGAGEKNDSVMDVLTQTGTVAELLVLDGSGTLQLFRAGRWRTLLDPVGAGATDLLCRVTPIQVLWEGPGRALMLNRGVESGRWQVNRVHIDREGQATFEDEGAPPDLHGVGRVLDLGARGVIASGGLGRLARRRAGMWDRLRPDSALTGNTALLIEGPAGSLILGNGGEGLAQYWPDEPDGPLACASIANTTFVRDAGRLGEEHLLGLPSNEGQSRPVFGWRFREPTDCELPPN